MLRLCGQLIGLNRIILVVPRLLSTTEAKISVAPLDKEGRLEELRSKNKL